MYQKERIKLAELIRNNPELPVMAMVEHDDIPFLGRVWDCGIHEYGKIINGKYVLKNSKAEKAFPETKWKKAIFVDVDTRIE